MSAASPAPGVTPDQPSRLQQVLQLLAQVEALTTSVQTLAGVTDRTLVRVSPAVQTLAPPPAATTPRAATRGAR